MEVYLDDDYKGITPLTLSVSYGNHAIKITKRELGYVDWFDIIQVSGEMTINAVLRLPTFITSTLTPKVPGSEGTYTITNYTTEILYRPVVIKTVSYMDRSGIVSDVEIYQVKPKELSECVTHQVAGEIIGKFASESAVALGIVSPSIMTGLIGPALVVVSIKEFGDCVFVGEVIPIGKTDKNGMLTAHIPIAIVESAEGSFNIKKADTIFFNTESSKKEDKKGIVVEEDISSLKNEYLTCIWYFKYSINRLQEIFHFLTI